MDDLLFVLLDFFLELVGEALIDLGLRGIAKFFNSERFANPWLAGVVYILLGAAMGGVSLLVFPHPLIHPAKIHGISLLISPTFTGLAMSLAGSILRRREQQVIPLESFRYGFTFAFGMAMVRVLFVR